jgi:PDDEXK-like uncharacterized protein DUF3799
MSGDHLDKVIDAAHDVIAADAAGMPQTAGVYDLPEDVYRAHQLSLSCTEARRMLDCPARYLWHKRNGEEHKADFDFGKAAHRAVLGVGEEVVVVDAEDWRTKAAQQHRDEARAAGMVPLLSRDAETVIAMATALRQHPIASRLLAVPGAPERTLLWADDRTGLMRRARLDWLPERPEVGRMIAWDYKTTKCAEPRAFARSVASYEYHQQAAWYLDGIRTLFGAGDAAFLFIAQEKQPPYLVTVCELDAVALEVGRQRNDRAIDRFIECTQTGEWPGYSTEIELITLPAWAEREDF